MEVMTRTITVTTGDDDKNGKISYSSSSINYKMYTNDAEYIQYLFQKNAKTNVII